MKIAIDLQEGFYEDEVTIFEKDREIYHAENVKTRTQIGLAASFEAELTGEKTTLRVVVAARRIDEKKEIELAENLHVAVSITTDDRLEWKTSEAPFMYM